jgi:hypothetical protein
MSDRRRVVYKSPLHRFSEIALVLLLTFGVSSARPMVWPDASAPVVVLCSLILGFALIPALGSRVAALRGAPVMSRDERTRRYLSELGPVGIGARPLATFGTAGTRRTGGRSLRRGG